MKKCSSGTVCCLRTVNKEAKDKVMETDSMKGDNPFCSLGSLNKILENIQPWEARFLDVENNSSVINNLIPRVADEASSEFLNKYKSHK